MIQELPWCCFAVHLHHLGSEECHRRLTPGVVVPRVAEHLAVPVERDQRSLAIPEDTEDRRLELEYIRERKENGRDETLRDHELVCFESSLVDWQVDLATHGARAVRLADVGFCGWITVLLLTFRSNDSVASRAFHCLRTWATFGRSYSSTGCVANLCWVRWASCHLRRRRWAGSGTCTCSLAVVSLGAVSGISLSVKNAAVAMPTT